MSARVSCPYCNAGFALIEVPPSGRADCPRCGERFPVRPAPDDGPTPGADARGPSAPGLPLPALAPPPAGLPARRAALFAAALVLVLAAGLGVYLSRGRPPTPDGDPPPDAAAVPPLSLRGLGYLPPGTNVAFAVRPGPVLEYAARTGKDPVDILTRAGVPADTLGALGKAGVTLGQIDHVAGGVAVPDAGGGELRFAVVVVLRRPPADEDEFLKALKARRTGPGRDARYAAEFAGLPLALARASATDWVFALADRDAEAAGGRELAPGLREAIAEKVSADAAAWVATDSARWADKPAVRVAVGRWLPILGKGRAAVAGLSLGESPRVRLAVRAADADAAARLRADFRSRATGEGTSAGGDGEWASFDAPFDPAVGVGPLRRLLDDAGK
ncbi:MAG: zinc-ribbon domain-containing protein [Gemmataceae bacterium]|nr:zinc-ribbon domain-containing protein [Gemmataceae bacterium]